MLRCTLPVASAFAATPALLAISGTGVNTMNRMKTHTSAKYSTELLHSTYMQSAINDNRSRRHRRLAGVNKALMNKFGAFNNAADEANYVSPKEAYNKWFLETYGVDLASDQGSVNGAPTLSNTGTLSKEACDNLDEAQVNRLKEYPAEEMDNEIKRVTYGRRMGTEQ